MGVFFSLIFSMVFSNSVFLMWILVERLSFPTSPALVNPNVPFFLLKYRGVVG